MSCLHRLSCGGQQSEDADRQQQIKPAIGTINGVARPEAAGGPQSVFYRNIAEDSDVKIPQVPSFSRLCLCVDKTVDGTIGDKDHHAAPEQVGENVTKGTVKCAQRNSDQRSQQGFPTGKASFLRGGESILQEIEKNNAGDPAEFRYIKDPWCFGKQ